MENVFNRRKKISEVPELKTVLAEVEKNKFKLGALYLMEGMAYEIQKFLYPNNSRSLDIPYSVIRRLVNSISNIKLETFDIIAICDASLMSFHPTESFYHICEALKIEKSKPDIIWYYSYVKEAINRGVTITGKRIITSYEYKVSEIIQHIEKIVPTPNLADQKSWLIDKLNKVKVKRMQNDAFLIDILNSEKPRERFLEFVNELGAPVIFNLNGEGYTLEKNARFHDASVYWSSIVEVMKILNGALQNVN